MIYVIMGGGPNNHVPPLSLIQEKYPNARWIGVDRGVIEILDNHISPYVAFGDFDSLNAQEREKIAMPPFEIYTYPEEKDATDMEIALTWAIEQQPEKIIVLGATGARLDHLFMNAYLLLKGIKDNIPIYIEDKWNSVTLLSPGTYNINKGQWTYVSLMPMTFEVLGLTLTGFRYPLKNTTLVQGSSLCISNEILYDHGEVSFSQGYLFLFRSKD
ncbi:thiamine diphosphokinase [Salipaludibacillus agaradhaerens]|uniref:thiamine diphosphokinase n=1 Tax=Salipaludibacillus agaradhaerens TaxID=76935 RepID=UPI00117E09D1|nr:thiamine diphosphokinase [Salipaludibacillus agaradhaerens]